MSLFWKSSFTESVSYDKLVQDLNSSTSFHRYIYHKDPYKVFLNFIGNILNNSDFEMLDHDFSKSEIENIGIEFETIETSVNINSICVEDKKDLIEKFISSESTSRIIMYTSGTTGKPKKINHSFNNLISACKSSEKFEKDVWAYAYNPTHFAGIQVFLQAFINGNPMIYLFDKDSKDIIQLIEEEKITRISATPTFYKKIIPLINSEMKDVKSLTSGGEKFDKNLMPHIERVFPNAKVVNVYASTEAGSLFSTRGEYFIIPERYKDKIKVSETGELMIHESLVGKSDDVEIINEYYNTKDVVEFESDSAFKFVSRNSDFINVGGYRVNPLEVEEFILSSGLVNEALVFGRKNSVIGNLIIAQIIKKDKDMDDKEVINKVKHYLKDKIQEWKEPKMYKVVECIETTRTGKKVRK